MADTATVEQVNATESVNETQETEKTFTQAELDEIIRKHDGKLHARYADYDALKEKASKYDELEEAGKSELQKATERADALQKELDDLRKESELRNVREKVSTDTGVPISLLSADTEEECAKQAQAILAFANKSGYPAVKDGGEISNITPKKTKGELFGEWLNDSLKH